MYNEAIEKLKTDVYRLGANCIVGLKVDIDEISGGGKSMFMITAIGTPVVAALDQKPNAGLDAGSITHVVTRDSIETLKRKKSYLDFIRNSKEVVPNNVWEFMVNNRVVEAYSDLLNRYSTMRREGNLPEEAIRSFEKWLVAYIGNLPEDKKIDILYQTLQVETDSNVIKQFYELIKQLDLVDLKKVKAWLMDPEFKLRKKGVGILPFHKSYYSAEDLADLIEIVNVLKTNFGEQGVRSLKKQLLSSKEKEVWSCECGKTGISIGENCPGCGQDIYGFTNFEQHPSAAISILKERIQLVAESIQ